jgi:hypothetical protein
VIPNERSGAGSAPLPPSASRPRAGIRRFAERRPLRPARHAHRPSLDRDTARSRQERVAELEIVRADYNGRRPASGWLSDPHGGCYRTDPLGDQFSGALPIEMHARRNEFPEEQVGFVVEPGSSRHAGSLPSIPSRSWVTAGVGRSGRALCWSPREVVGPGRPESSHYAPRDSFGSPGPTGTVSRRSDDQVNRPARPPPVNLPPMLGTRPVLYRSVRPTRGCWRSCWRLPACRSRLCC